MHLSTVFAYFALFISSLCYAQIPSKSGEFNITSPLDDGVYVAGQQLPISYVILDSGSRLSLNIYFQPAPGINSTGAVIAKNADVSEVAGAVVTINNKYYWQHTYNYAIPPTAPPGSYFVLFESVNTSTNTSVPVIIRPYVNMTTATASSSATAPTASATESSNTNKSIGGQIQPMVPLVMLSLSVALSYLL
ncbi:hypothetical protein [Absidia glauca]|uniref:Uncharacterized protein n=1 Tax=Absidia glauca TaxID=4829 RepID=A0A168N1N6_ABSGL|nr:hypothetical protein [Absidia glauca]